MRSARARLAQRAQTVLVDTRVFRRNPRQVVHFLFAGLELSHLQERGILIEDRSVAGHAQVLIHHERKPHQIIGESRAHAASALRMPPVLHVALHELARGRAHDVFARYRRLGVDERHHILKLVPEAVGPTALVERGARPHPAAQSLVERPSVGNGVERRLRRGHFDGRESFLPRLDRTLHRRTSALGGAIFVREPACLFLATGGPERDDDLARLSRREVDHGAKRTAWIDPRPGPVAELRAAHRRRICLVAVSPEELPAIRGMTRRRFAHGEERHPVGELLVEVVGGEHGATFGVVGGVYLVSRVFAQHAERPLHERSHRYPATSFAAIGDAQQGELDRIRRWNSDLQSRGDPGVLLLEGRCAGEMAHLERRGVFHRRGRGAPHFAAFLIAQVENIAGRIAHRVVVPRSEAVEVAADSPAESAAALGDHEAGVRIRHHVRPGRFGELIAVHEDRVAVPVIEASDAVVEVQLRVPVELGGLPGLRRRIIRAAMRRWRRLRLSRDELRRAGLDAAHDRR